jgi:hypothetical protein
MYIHYFFDGLLTVDKDVLLYDVPSEAAHALREELIDRGVIDGNDKTAFRVLPQPNGRAVYGDTGLSDEYVGIQLELNDKMSPKLTRQEFAIMIRDIIRKR